MSAQAASMTLTVSDVSRQRVRHIEDVPRDTTAAEIVQSYLDDLGIPRNEPDTGRSLTYRALLPREGRHLRPNERIGDSLEENDWVVLQPNIDAG
jgi:hypothetical protein